jgi:hypothetical protein
MLFRKPDGTLIEIIRNNYKNDEIYYKKIMSAKCCQIISQNNSSYTRKLMFALLEDTLNNSDNQDNDEE